MTLYVIRVITYSIGDEMKRILCVFFISSLAVLLPACSTAKTNVQTEEQISEVELTQTATVFSNLEPVLIQENDLPQGYSAGSTTQKVPTYYQKLFLPDAEYFIRQQIQKDESAAGQVDVFYFVSGETAKLAFDDVKSDMQRANELSGVGEEAAIEITLEGQGAVQDFVGIIFTQCHVTVRVSILGTTDDQAAISYVENLSERLKPYVCD